METTQLRGRAIGFIFQYHYLLPAFTALENVMMPMLAARGRADDEMRETAAALLDRVGLTPWRDHKASDISGGQQQRVAIARALAMNPALVLADEPSGNLDTENADAVFDLMRDVNERSGTTFLIVTHDPRLAQRCDRIVELVDGRIVSDRANTRRRAARLAPGSGCRQVQQSVSAVDAESPRAERIDDEQAADHRDVLHEHDLVRAGGRGVGHRPEIVVEQRSRRA